jgi:hypothetical protein
VEADGTLGDLLVIAARETRRPDVICAELIRRTPVVVGPRFDGLEIARLGPGG